MIARKPKVVVFNGGFNTIHSDDDIHIGDRDFVIKQLDLGLSMFRKAGVSRHLHRPIPDTWLASRR